MTASRSTGRRAERGPLGGAETAFVGARRGVGARAATGSRCATAAAPRCCHNGVHWAPLVGRNSAGLRSLHRQSRPPRDRARAGKPRRRLFWLHNPAGYLKKPRNLWRLARYRPILVTTGAYHATTVPRWLPCGGREIIPYGVLDRFRAAAPREPPPPRAIFTSNPLRGLDWLLDLWVARIAPAVPRGGTAHLCRRGGLWRRPRAPRMEEVLARADSARRARGAPLRAGRPRSSLAAALAGARVMLYRGDPGETFCLALAEAQAMGVPAVVQPLGSAGERVIDGVTGRVAEDDDAFVDGRDRGAARRRACGGSWHLAALAHQGGLSWDAVAAQVRSADAHDPTGAAGDGRRGAWRGGDIFPAAGGGAAARRRDAAGADPPQSRPRATACAPPGSACRRTRFRRRLRPGDAPRLSRARSPPGAPISC